MNKLNDTSLTAVVFLCQSTFFLFVFFESELRTCLSFLSPLVCKEAADPHAVAFVQCSPGTTAESVSTAQIKVFQTLFVSS